VRAGRNAPMAKTMLVPEAWSNTAAELPQAWMDMYSYCNSVMEPWDGPAALAMTDGRWVCAGLDRNGLRPMRYVVTGDGLMIAGSETGMVPVDEATVVEKGALGPGQMIAVDMERAEAVPRHGDQGCAGRRATLRRMGRQDHRPGRGDARRHRKASVRGFGTAPPPGRRRLFHRGAGTDPRADGRGREGNAGLYGRRHPGGGAVEPVSPAQPLFPAELQPGHEPAHRLACANTG
jgi:hypothetical protein